MVLPYKVLKEKFDKMVETNSFVCSVCKEVCNDARLVKVFRLVKERSPIHIFPEFYCEECLINYQKEVNGENFRQDYNIDKLLESLEKDSQRFYMQGDKLAYRSPRKGVWGRIKV